MPHRGNCYSNQGGVINKLSILYADLMCYCSLQINLQFIRIIDIHVADAVQLGTC
jgi:hypothetical protein